MFVIPKMNTQVTYGLLNPRSANSTLNEYVGDGAFGPFLQVPGHTTFDFTLLFEETILSLGPSAALLVMIPPRVIWLWRMPRKVTGSYLQTVKMVLLITFTVLQIVNVVEISRSSLRTRASLAAALLALAASMGLSVLSYAEHVKNIRPSSIINAYLLLTIPFDAAQLRSRWSRASEDVSTNAVASSVLVVKLVILLSEAIGKRNLLLTPFTKTSHEATSGLYSRGLFWWLNPLFRLGFRKVVDDDDLFAADEDLLSKRLDKRFSKHWAKRTKYPNKHNLIYVVSRAMIWPFAAGIFPKLALVFFRFMQPLLVKRITQLIREPDSVSAGNRGWGLTAAFGLVFVGVAIAGAVSQHKANRLATMIRGCLVTAIYTQTLDLSITSLDESAAVTLMSSDVERICDPILAIHSMWSAPIEIGIAIWLLQKEIGLALLGPLLVTTVAISGPFILSKYMGKTQIIWIEKVQTRIDTTAKMLHSMKGIKMLGLNERLSSIVSQLRRDEITESLKMRKLFVVMLAFGNMSDIFVPAAAFAIYVIVAKVNGQILDVTSAYTALSLITLLVAPIRAFVFTAPMLMAAVGCFDRVEAFLSLPTKRDHRMLVTTPLTYQSTLLTSNGGSRLSDGIELEDMSRRPTTNPTAEPIRVQNLSLAWSEELGPVINDVSIEFQPAKLTMIIGPVGCGKSSLLKGLLGETPSSKGSVYINRAHAAFIDQTSWIRNSTIRENIIGVSSFEPEWYANVIRACALDSDITAFPKGDETPVGSAGTALSGGQRLRIAIARAVYSRHQLIIIDDVFSGLDAMSEDLIFSRLLSKSGLLRRMGTTVILVTHAVHRLSFADQIIVLGANGSITEQGTHGELMSIDGYVRGLATRHKMEGDAQNVEQASLKGPTDEDTARQNAAADLKRPVGNWAIYKYYFDCIGMPRVIIWAVLMVVYSVLLRFPDLWIKFWTSSISAHGNSVNGLYLGILIAIECLAMTAIMALCLMLFVFMIPKSASTLHQHLLGTVEKAPLSFFTSTDTGQIVNRFSQDLSVIDMELPISGIILAHQVCLAVIQAVFISVSASYFATVLPFVLLAVYILQKFYLRTSRQIRLMDLEAKAPLYSNFLESLNGLVTIRAFGWAEDMKKRNMELLDASQRPFYLLYCIQRWLALVADLLVAALAVILVALLVRFRQGADAGLVGVALINIMSFSVTLSEVVRNWTAIETSVGAVSRIKNFVEDTPSEHLPQEAAIVPEDWPKHGKIIVSNISATYHADLEPALQDITLSLAAGEKLGICGPSGSGKSSFVALLFHMLEISNGLIEIDGIDMSTIPRQLLRERLTVIPQDPVFVKGTIRQNLDPSNVHQANVSALESVLEKVGLWNIITTAGGFDTPMSAEELLSHGQRQLFCLARAMLKPTKILVIDEATASVDLMTDRLMQEIITEWFKNCTIIAVAHRLETIRDYDKIAVFENGRVVEVDAPGVLLRREESRFRELWESRS